MANHVYFNISIEGLTDDEFNSSVKMVKGTRNDYEGNPYDYEEYDEIENQPFMNNVDKSFDADNYLKDSYDWYCREVGAKWCHLEEVQDCYISGYSAWRQPTELVLNIIQYFANKYDDNITASMTYEDEFRNFMGKQYFDTEKYDDWEAVEGEYHETDGAELVELFNEMYPSIDTTVEDFDWHAEYKVEGESVYPSEMLDQLADEFWESS